MNKIFLVCKRCREFSAYHWLTWLSRRQVRIDFGHDEEERQHLWPHHSKTNIELELVNSKQPESLRCINCNFDGHFVCLRWRLIEVYPIVIYFTALRKSKNRIYLIQGTKINRNRPIKSQWMVWVLRIRGWRQQLPAENILCCQCRDMPWMNAVQL